MFFLMILILGSFSSVYAQEFPLDRPYQNLESLIDKSNHSLPWRSSDTLAVIAKQTPVRSQGFRGTCSIFATTAYIESLMVMLGQDPMALDLSEEWLTYTVDRNHQSYGSPVSENLHYVSELGMIQEKSWAYDYRHWKPEFPEAQKFCGHLIQDTSEEGQKLLQQCFTIHRDPRLLDHTPADLRSGRGPFTDSEFAQYIEESQQFLNSVWPQLSGIWNIARNSLEVKTELFFGRPVLLSLPFFYGAWNHRGMEHIGLGKPDLEAFARGEVGYPDPRSLDFSVSLEKKNLNAHSILLVGYDDDREITTTQVMRDGSTKKTTYKGVYYFKNSWGPKYFGKDFVLENKPLPGYGMIVQEHGHHFGMFVYLR